MKNTIKKIGLVSVALSGILFSGCQNSNGTNNGVTATTTDVTVARGPVMDSLVTDANGKVGIQVANTNVYRFTGELSYPVIAVGGWIDVDGDGILSLNDVKLDVELKSNTNNITPLTTYTFDVDDIQEKVKKEELLALLNNNTNGVVYTEDDLDDLPEEMDDDLQKTLNAVYSVAKANKVLSLTDSTIDTEIENMDISEIEIKKSELENLYVYNNTLTPKENAKLLEESVMDKLEIEGHLDRINENDMFDFDEDVMDLSKLVLETGESIKIYKGIPTDILKSMKKDIEKGLDLTNVSSQIKMEIEDYKLDIDLTLNGNECDAINLVNPGTCEFFDMSAKTGLKENSKRVNIVLKMEIDTENIEETIEETIPNTTEVDTKAL